jgi:hypothetical protein
VSSAQMALGLMILRRLRGHAQAAVWVRFCSAS